MSNSITYSKSKCLWLLTITVCDQLMLTAWLCNHINPWLENEKFSVRVLAEILQWYWKSGLRRTRRPRPGARSAACALCTGARRKKKRREGDGGGLALLCLSYRGENRGRNIPRNDLQILELTLEVVIACDMFLWKFDCFETSVLIIFGFFTLHQIFSNKLQVALQVVSLGIFRPQFSPLVC